MTKRKADSKLVIGTKMSVCCKFKQLKHFIKRNCCNSSPTCKTFYLPVKTQLTKLLYKNVIRDQYNI